MYYTGMIPKCLIVEETVTKYGKFVSKDIKVFLHSESHWMRNYIDGRLSLAYSEFGDNFDLDRWHFVNGAKVTITHAIKREDGTTVVKTEEAHGPCVLTDTVMQVTADNGLGAIWEWRIYEQNEKVPESHHDHMFD